MVQNDDIGDGKLLAVFQKVRWLNYDTPKWYTTFILNISNQLCLCCAICTTQSDFICAFVTKCFYY